MEVIEVSGYTARCQAKGVERDVSLFLLQDDEVSPGDFVMVHVGYAIQKITPQDARSAWQLYDEMLAAEDGGRAAAHGSSAADAVEPGASDA